MTRPQQRNDDGFTIVELLISMGILGIIITPLATAFFIGLGTFKTTDADIANSSDAQVASLFFSDDAASADSVATNADCGSSSDGDPVVQFNWQDGSISRRVAYRLATDASAAADLQVGTAYRLNRVSCD